MTVSQLYSLYCAGHAEAWRISNGGVLRSFELSVNGGGLTDLECLILEFALHDATNGTPMRSRRSFDRAVEQGAEVLEGLGLRRDRDGTAGDATRLNPLTLDEAA
jgi:hypothetical protein